MRRPLDRKLLRSVSFAFCLCVILVGTDARAQGQDKCDPEATLTLATEEFNAGHFFGLPDLLKPCLEKRGFTKEQEVRAYQLLTQTYLIMEDPLAAEASYLNLLKANPEYVSNPDRDPIDVVYLSQKFTATPIFSWFASVGSNVTLPRVIGSNISHEGSQQNYYVRPRWNLGGGIIWNYNDNLTAELGLHVVNSSYRYVEDKMYTYDELTVNETQYTLKTPLSVKYTFIRKKGISPYAYAGLSSRFLLSAKQDFLLLNRTPTLDGNEVVTGFAESREEGEQTISYKRDFFNPSFHVGTGFRWKYKLDYFFVDLKYSFGMNNVVNEETFIRDLTRPGSDEFAFRVGYVDDYFRLDQAFISVGYIKPLYKPRKLKRARSSKGVLRDVKKESDEENQ